VAGDVERSVPADPMNPIIPSQYVEALDSVGLPQVDRYATELMPHTGPPGRDVPWYCRLLEEAAWRLNVCLNLSTSFFNTLYVTFIEKFRRSHDDVY
jgi:hypothetical protein